MALIRGLGGLCPCPICLISSQDLSDLSIQAIRRSAADVLKLFEETNGLPTAAERDAPFKAQGLRRMEVSYSIYFSKLNFAENL